MGGRRLQVREFNVVSQWPFGTTSKRSVCALSRASAFWSTIGYTMWEVCANSTMFSCTQSEPLAQTCPPKMIGLALRVAGVPVQLPQKMESYNQKLLKTKQLWSLAANNYRISGDAKDTPVLLTMHESQNVPLQHVTRVGFYMMVMMAPHKCMAPVGLHKIGHHICTLCPLITKQEIIEDML